MDEIIYWIHTKRAPCLYDDSLKLNSPDFHSSDLKVIHYKEQDRCSGDIKKNKTVLFDDSESSIELQNIFFEPPGQFKNKRISESLSSSLISDVDFNIKNSSIDEKVKKSKIRRNSQSVLHKKNKVVTSTPIVNSHLSRSLRKVQHNLNSNKLHNSLKHLNDSVCNVTRSSNISLAVHSKYYTAVDSYKLRSKIAADSACPVLNDKGNLKLINGQFDDLSDVSGFTASYIRSTKVHSFRTPGSLRNNVNKILISRGKCNKKENKTLANVSKSMIAKPPFTSTLNNIDSSNNVIHIATAKSDKVDNNSKMIDSNQNNIKKTRALNTTLKNKTISTSDETNAINSPLSESSSRYPKRHKMFQETTVQLRNPKTKRRKRESCNGDFCNMDIKENPNVVPAGKKRNWQHLQDRSVANTDLTLQTGACVDNSP